MIVSFFKGVTRVSLAVVALYVVVVIVAYYRYRKEKKDAVAWGIDILACLEEIASRVDPIIKVWDEKNPSSKQRELLERYADGVEEILKLIHVYLELIEKPRQGCVAVKCKVEVEQRIKELDILSRILVEREKKTK